MNTFIDLYFYCVFKKKTIFILLLFTILKKLGYNWATGCYHLSYGMIALPDGKMKSREGTVVDADDLMGMIVNDAKAMTKERGHLEGMSDTAKETLYSLIGLGGLKYFLLKVDPKMEIQVHLFNMPMHEFNRY